MAESGQAIILRGNARALPLPDESVNLIITSPPYWDQRSYRDAGEHYPAQIGSEPTPQLYLEHLWECMVEWWRVLKPGGSCFVNMGDKRAGSGAPGTTSGFSGRRPTGAPIPGQRPVQGERSGITGSYNHRAGFGRAKSKMLLPHRFAIGCEDGLADPQGIGWVVRQDGVWFKLNGMPEPATDRFADRHEFVFHFTKQGRYFAAMDEVREPHARTWTPGAPNGSKAFEVVGPGDARAMRNDGLSVNPANPLGKAPGSVWPMASEPLLIPAWAKAKYGLGDHFAAFPTELPRRLILGFSPSGALVLDPFGGTGTTAMVAKALGRVGISVDLSADYCRLARWRIEESGHGRKAEQRTWGERQGSIL